MFHYLICQNALNERQPLFQLCLVAGDNCRRWGNVCAVVMSGFESDTDTGEPQGSDLWGELTNLFDIISSERWGGKNKSRLLLRQETKSSSSTAHSLFISLSYTSRSVIFHSQNPSSQSTILYLYISLSLSHGRRSYSLMRALHADSHNSQSPSRWVILESCWALLMEYLPLGHK